MASQNTYPFRLAFELFASYNRFRLPQSFLSRFRAVSATLNPPIESYYTLFGQYSAVEQGRKVQNSLPAVKIDKCNGEARRNKSNVPLSGTVTWDWNWGLHSR